MTKLLLFILVTSGITNSIVNNGFFNFIRNTKIKVWNKFWGCSMCIGFWVGLGLYYLMDLYKVLDYECHILKITSDWRIDMILYAFISSLMSFIICGFAKRFDK